MYGDENNKGGEWNKNDKIFGVIQDQSHRMKQQADNPFLVYQSKDLEPLMIDEHSFDFPLVETNNNLDTSENKILE